MIKKLQDLFRICISHFNVTDNTRHHCVCGQKDHAHVSQSATNFTTQGTMLVKGNLFFKICLATESSCLQELLVCQKQNYMTCITDVF